MTTHTHEIQGTTSKTYRHGDCFILDRKDIVMLCQVGPGQYCLIGLTSAVDSPGNRYTEPVDIVGNQVPFDVIQSMCGFDIVIQPVSNLLIKAEI